MAADGLSLGMIAVGGLLTYAGVRGKSVPGALQALIQGQSPATAPQLYPISGTPQGAEQPTPAGASIYPGVPPGTTAGGDPAQNQALARLLAVSAHPDWITGQQWADWVSLWNRESGWSQTADTRVTGAGGDNANSAVFAYGIPQARPYSKMPRAAWPPDKGGQSDPSAQISWGIAYIAGTYGSPSAAWAHEQQYGWY